MILQDIHEADLINASNYRKKISKYKLLITKFNHNEIEALKHCATNDFRLIENIPQEQMEKLTEQERNYITRWT